MKTTRVERRTTRKTGTSRTEPHARGAQGVEEAQSVTPRLARPSLRAAADLQIAEIERTFSLRYEW